MKRKILSLMLSLIFIVCLFPTASAVNNADAAAQMLDKLGLFLGTDKGYELERSMTRAEAAVMLVRYLGAEDAAMSGEFRHPFSDVPQWVDSYVGWLYTQGLTKGVSATEFASDRYITAWEYAMFLSRTVWNSENYINTMIASTDEIERIDSEKSFTRADAVIFSVNALSAMYTKEGSTDSGRTPLLAEHMVNLGLFTKEELDEASLGVVSPEYIVNNDGSIIRTIFNIEMKTLPTKHTGIFIIWGDNDNIVAQLDTDSAMDIMLIDAHSGEIRDKYTLEDDITSDEYGSVYPRELGEQIGEFFFGEAGLYRYDGKNLIQITDRAVNELLIEDDGYILLTHKPGKRIYGGIEGLGGNEIIKLYSDGTEKYLTPEDMDIDIGNIWMSDGLLCFSRSYGVGMGHYDTYTYRIESDGKITVTDFSAGRPEVMNGFSWDDMTAYKPGYIKDEQTRIDALGY